MPVDSGAVLGGGLPRGLVVGAGEDGETAAYPLGGLFPRQPQLAQQPGGVLGERVSSGAAPQVLSLPLLGWARLGAVEGLVVPRQRRSPPPPVGQPPCLLFPRLRPEPVLWSRVVPDPVGEALPGPCCVLPRRPRVPGAAGPPGGLPLAPGAP